MHLCSKHYIRPSEMRSYPDVRIYVVLGEQDYHLGLLEAMHQEGIFNAEKEEYFIVGINSGEAWDAEGKGENDYIQ